MSNGSWFHWSVILWKKLYFRTLDLAYFFFKVKEYLALSLEAVSFWVEIYNITDVNINVAI